MAFKFTKEDGSNISMAQATQMLESALDKSDTGEQAVNGVLKIEDANGTPIEIQDKNQVITQKYVDDKFDAYMTLNISIPHNIDLDAELTITSTEFYHSGHSGYNSENPLYTIFDTLYRCKLGNRTSIKGIQLPKNGKYKIKYESKKTTTVCETTLDLKEFDFGTNVYNMEIIPDATLGVAIKINGIQGDAIRQLYSTTHNGGVHNNYYYAIFLSSCDRIILPNKNVEMFIMSAGKNAKRLDANSVGYGFGGKREEITANGNGDIASVTIGMDSWVDSSVTIGDDVYTTANSTNYSDKSDGVFPFSESAFVNLYGASGSTSDVRYSTGGGFNSLNWYPGKFFGAGACGQGGTAYGFQGIVIMRWKVDEEV